LEDSASFFNPYNHKNLNHFGWHISGHNLMWRKWKALYYYSPFTKPNKRHIFMHEYLFPPWLVVGVVTISCNWNVLGFSTFHVVQGVPCHAWLSTHLHELRQQDLKSKQLDDEQKTIDILYTLDSASLFVKLKPKIFQLLPQFEYMAAMLIVPTC
jgi:hypothetical protein